MGWLLPRLLAATLSVAVAGWVGWLIGGVQQFPLLGALVGAVLGAQTYALMDALRGRQFLKWLQTRADVAPPRDSGLWGEAGYRVERSVRTLEEKIGREQTRLDQFLSAIEASPNGVMMLDVNDQIEWCNSVAADHFGIDPQRDRLQPITNLVRAPIFVAHLQSGQFDEAVSFPAPGSRGTISVLIKPYGDAMKLVLSQDTTERERSDSMRRGFVANVSHEIRTPLTVLSGFIETMSSLQLTEVERRRVIELMAQQAQRMQHLVGDLLTLAQLEGSPRPPADRWVPVQQLLTQVRAAAEALSAGRHTLVCDSAKKPERSVYLIAGAEQELHSAIANLVNNAIRYTPSGGAVRVSWLVRVDGVGELEVRDTGIGIAKEHLPRLTERFYRVDGSRSRDTGGTGLGLSIVKHVVQRHGGELEVSSEPGNGSSFKLVFPAARVRIANSPIESESTASQPGEDTALGMAG